MPRPSLVVAASALWLFCAATVAPATSQQPLAQPTLNPATSEIAFVSGGDIWVGPAAGGVAHLLVSHEAEESRPLYSPDGARLAFESDRAGSADLYVLELGTGELTRLTWSDAGESLDAWAPDGA